MTTTPEAATSIHSLKLERDQLRAVVRHLRSKITALEANVMELNEALALSRPQPCGDCDISGRGKSTWNSPKSLNHKAKVPGQL